MSALPELDVARARRYVDDLNARVPDHVRDQIRYELDLAPGTLTIVECRPPWHEDAGSEWSRSPVARLSYTKARGEWSLQSLDQNGKYRTYPHAPAAVISELLEEITADPTGIFWG